MCAHHILIIDDRPGEVDSLLPPLRAAGWRVSTASGGNEGLQQAQALVPDLILLDVMMADMSGFAVCRLLNAGAQTQDIPVLFLTSATTAEQRLQGLEHGGVDYIIKPFLPAEVVARIRIHLRLSRRESSGAGDDLSTLLSDDEVMLRAAMRLISQNLSELPSLDEIARQVGAYDKKLSAIFRRHLGMTVFAWIREERLRVASDWLADADKSIATIATDVGFHSAANFATAFRKRMGVTPSQYRAALRRQPDAGGHDCEA